MSRSVAHPDRLIERLSGAFTDLVDSVRIGVDSAVGLPAKQRWEGKALPILVQNLTDLQKEIHQYQSSEAWSVAEPSVAVALPRPRDGRLFPGVF